MEIETIGSPGCLFLENTGGDRYKKKKGVKYPRVISFARNQCIITSLSSGTD